MTAEDYSIKHPQGMNDCYTMHVEVASHGANANIFYKAMESFAKYYHEEQLAKIKEKVRVELNHYHSECGDGCCTNYGTITTVNGVEMEVHNQDAGTILKEVLTHLGYNTEIIHLDNGEEI